MKSDRAQGRIVTVWREYFLDLGCDPPEWKPHPHDRYKLGGRIFLAFTGSLLIVLPIAVLSGVTTKLDDGSLQIGWTFWVVSVAVAVAWIASVLLAAHSERKLPRQYFFAGMRPPAWGLVLMRTILPYVE